MKLIILSLSLLSFSCAYDPPTGGFEIKNNSKSNVYVYCTCEDKIPCETKLSLILNHTDNEYDSVGNKITGTFYPNYRIVKDSTSFFAINGTPKKPKLCEDGKIKLYFIEEEIMKKNSWNKICKNELYIKKIILSENQLIKLKWKFIYSN